MCGCHRAIEIDHRSARSRCRLLRSSSIVITGVRWGGPRPTEIGGVIQPCRKASINRASASSGLRLGLGGPISATTRSRSVTRTVSPPAASRTYSLSLFLRVLRPTERITQCSYQRLPCQTIVFYLSGENAVFRSLRRARPICSSNLMVQLGAVTEDLNRRWYERNTGLAIRDVQRRIPHPV